MSQTQRVPNPATLLPRAAGVGGSWPGSAHARVQSVFVWLAWAACTAIAGGLVVAYGPRLPYSDDWNIVPVITGHDAMTPRWLWAQHNEHRIVIAKLLFVMLARLTGADFRSAIYVSILLFSALSAASIVAVRSIRGRTSWLDVFYPIFLLNVGQSAFQWGFEFQFTLVTVLAIAISIVLIRCGSELTLLSSLLLALFVICLPISGGSGLLFVPVIAFWMVIRALRQIIPNPAAPVAPFVALGSACASVAISAAYFIDYASVPHPWPAPDVRQFLSASLQVFSAGFGSLSDHLWPLFGIATALFVVASLAHVVVVALDRHGIPLRRCQAADIAVFIIAFMPVAISVAYGRGGQGWLPTNHYSTLALPVLYWSFMAWSLETPRLPARLLQAALLVTISLFDAGYAIRTVRTGPSRMVETAAIEYDLRSGVAPEIIVSRHIKNLFFIDLPETRRMVQAGIDDFRAAGFRQYGPASPSR